MDRMNPLNQLLDVVSRSGLSEVNIRKLVGLASQMERISGNLEGIEQEIQQLIKIIDNRSNPSREMQVLAKIRYLEKFFLMSFPGDLNLNPMMIENWLNNAYVSDPHNQRTLEDLFPSFLMDMCSNNPLYRFIDLWGFLSHVLRRIGLEDSNMIRSFAKYLLFGNPLAADEQPLNIREPGQFFIAFFGSPNYARKILQANQLFVYQMRCKNIDRDLIYEQGAISMKVTTIPTNFKIPGGLQEKDEFILKSHGLENTPRGCADGIVMFGKNNPEFCFCDVRLPENDPSIEEIHCIMIMKHGLNNKLIDTSRRGNVAIRVNSNHGRIRLHIGTIIRFSKECILEVKDIVMTMPNSDEVPRGDYADPDADLDGGADDDLNPGNQMNDELRYYQYSSKLVLKHIEGPHVNSYESVRFDAEEQKRNPKELIVGVGGGGIEPTVFFPRSSGVSRKHALLEYENQCWYIRDNSSSNGTYILLKNSEEYHNGFNSRPVGIFDEVGELNRPLNDATIAIGEYVFFLRKFG